MNNSTEKNYTSYVKGINMLSSTLIKRGFTLFFTVVISLCALPNAIFATEAEERALEHLVSGYYVIEDLKVSIDNRSEYKQSKALKAYQEVKNEAYFYYNAETMELTLVTPYKSSTAFVEFDDDSEKYTLDLLNTLGIIKTVSASTEFFSAKDASHFQCNIIEEAFFADFSIQMQCARVEKNNQKLRTIQKKVAEEDARISSFFSETKTELATQELTCKAGWLRNLQFGSVILPISEPCTPTTKNDSYFFFDVWKNPVFNSKSNFTALYNTKQCEIFFAALEGKESLFNIDTAIQKQVSRPEYVVLKEKNGVIFYDIDNDTYIAQFHYYDSKRKLHTVARTVPTSEDSLERTLNNYRFIRTLDPMNRTGESIGIDFNKVIKMPVEEIEETFRHTYTCKIFLSPNAVTNMLKRSSTYDQLLKEQSSIYTNYPTYFDNEDNPLSGKMRIRYSLLSPSRIKKELATDGWNIVYEDGPCIIRARQDKKMTLSAHYISFSNGLTIDIAYDAPRRSPLAAVNFIQQIRNIKPPEIPLYPLKQLQKQFAQYTNVKTFKDNEKSLIVSKGEKEGVIKYDGTEILPLKYQWIRSENYGYSAKPYDDFFTDLYFDKQGNQIKEP